MNQKRKAELQRKLAMTSVPRPPAGLAERIKADIPHELMNTERDRERLSRSTAFSVRVAASILLLISATYLSIHLMSRSSESVVPAVAPAKLAKRDAQQAMPAAPPSAVAAPQAEVTITLADEMKPVARREQPKALAKEKIEKDEKAIGSIVAETAAAPVTPPAFPPTPTAEPLAQGAEAPMRAERMSANTAAGTVSIAKSARAGDVSFAAPREVFGISIDPRAFDRVKHTIEQGQKPAAGSVDVAALVNYFAGTSRPPRRDVDLDVEASRAPITESGRALIRFTVDTSREITGADLDISLNSAAVASHRLIGAEELKTQATLAKNMSVTGMLDVKLKPRVSPRTTVATLTLRYRSSEDGKPRTITRTVEAGDLTRTWASSTRRHRLATLGAVWSESLNEGSAAGDVATTAERLSTEEPDDARARELAALATAFSRLQSSGPTGSGR